MTPDPLSPRAQALVDAARDGLGPDDAAIARMQAKVIAGAAGAGAGAGAGGAGAGAASAGAGATGLGVKLALVGALALVVVGATWWVMREPGARGPGTAQVPSVVTAAPPAVAAPPDGTHGATGPAPAGAAVPGAAHEAVHAAVAGTPAPAAPEPPPPSRRPPGDRLGATSARSSLAAEVALVDDAMAALRRDDAAAALLAADEHVARFGRRGQLAEEAAAIRVEAMCRLGDGRWAEALDAFDVGWPRSAQRPRLSTACKGAK